MSQHVDFTRRTLLGSLALAPMAWSGRGTASSAADDVGTAIENGLLERTRLAGEAPRTFNIGERLPFYACSGAQVALIEDGRIAWSGAYGTTRAGGGEPVRRDTLFQPGSIGKIVTALASLRLVERGALGLDEDVGARLRSWRLPSDPVRADEPVTLRRLLSHSAGLNMWGILGYRPGSPLPTTIETLDDAPVAGPGLLDPGRLQFIAAPGAQWRYSGGGYLVVQQLMEDVTGTRFARLVRDLVLDPLAMDRTTFDLIMPGARGNIAFGHRMDGAPMEEGWLQIPQAAVGGWWSCADDVARLLLAIEASANGCSGALVSSATAQAMLTPGLNNWGLGVQIVAQADSLRFQHGGGTEGYRSHAMCARGGRGIVVLTNGDIGDQLIGETLRSASAAREWGFYSQRVRDAIATPPDAQELIGRYALEDERGRRAVMEITQGRGSGLEATAPIWGGWSAPRAMHAASPDLYFFREHGAELRVLRGAGQARPEIAVDNLSANLRVTRL